MGRQEKMSNEERLRRKREAEKKRREVRRSNPELREKDKKARSERYTEAKRSKKVKMIGEMSEREKRRQRKAWRIADRKYYQKKKESRVSEKSTSTQNVRLIKKLKSKEITPTKEAKKLMSNINSRKGKEEVRRKLIFGSAIQSQIKRNLKEMTRSQKQMEGPPYVNE